MVSSILFSYLIAFTPIDTTIAPLPFQHITKKEGLSNSAITSIYMDRYDYTWFGSWDGLNRYDGSMIKVYMPESFQKGTLSNNIIRDFIEDKQGNLWIISHKGINKYNRDTDTFSSYLTDLSNIPILENNMRMCLGPDSTLWVSILGKGINQYDYLKNEFTPIVINNVENEWLKNVSGIASENGLQYLLGSDGKLLCLHQNKVMFSKQLIQSQELRLHHFFSILSTSYIALTTEQGNLLIYSLSDISQQPTKIKIDFAISSINENRTKTALWVGTEHGGVFKITKKKEEFVLHNYLKQFPILSNDQRKILSIIETKQDILWIGTDGDGVYKFLTKPKPFNSIPKGGIENGGISNSIVRSIYENTDGTLYIGTRGGGLNIIKSKRSTEVLNTSSGLSNNAVLSLNKDANDNLWIGVDGEGIDMLETNTGKIYHFPRDFENKPTLSFKNVYSICHDSYGGIWLGTSGYGVIHLEISKTKSGNYKLDSYRQLSHRKDDELASINSNVVYSIIEESPNIVWFGTRGSGVYRYNSLTHKIDQHFYTNSTLNQRLSNDDVLSLALVNGILWVGTSGGLNKISLHTKPFIVTHYTQRNGLPNNTIHAILTDSKNVLWMSTNNGLVSFNGIKESFQNYDTNDGLQNNEYTDGASFHSRTSEKLFFGGINGLDIVYPTKLDTVSAFPRLTISEFQIHNVIVTPRDSSGILKQHIDLTSELILNHDQNFISFHFTTLNYWNKQRTTYAYYLENFDKTWNYIGTQSVVNLTNVPPGEYILHINYTNENGVWSDHAKTINITVRPPFWKTFWAYAFYTLLLIVAQIGIILVIRQRAKTKRSASINEFKLKQLKELNDYKLQFFTNVAHEFRTPLTLIFGPVSALLKKANNSWEQTQLKTIYSNSLRLQKLIEELIQFRKIESGKEKAEVLNLELVSFTQHIVNTFHQYALDHDLNIEFIPETEVLWAWVDPNKIEKILINLISNAIKYNTKGGQVQVILKEEKDQAIFKVKDNGIGIADSDRDKIFESFYQNPDQHLDSQNFSISAGIGLSLTKSLLKLHSGELLLESAVGKGSTFTALIPIKRNVYTGNSIDKKIILPNTNLSDKVAQEFTYQMKGELATSSLVKIDTQRIYSIVIVDDNHQIIALLESILADKYKLYTAENGKDAISILEKEKIDLIISDVLMPEMDGLTLCAKVKENILTSHIPVILLTAKAEIEDRIEGLQMGADSYIPKPFHPDHLFIRIEKLIKSREQIKQRFENLSELELDKIKTGIGEKDDAFFIRITQSIENHLSDPDFSADHIADDVGMSKASLYKKVKATVGLTPHGLIKQYRLRKAADLLNSSTMSVSEVIYETGFNSRSYFYKSFNEMFHCHPKDFGRMNKS